MRHPTIFFLFAHLLAAGLPAADEPGIAGMTIRPPHSAMTASALHIDTRTSQNTWNQCALSAPGRIAAGKTYLARVTCRIDELGNDSFLLVLIRPSRTADEHSDLAVSECSAVGKERTIQLRFTVPAGRDDYALQIHTRKQLMADVTDVTITEIAPDESIPIGGGGQAAELPAPAAGAGEFGIDPPRPAAIREISVADFGANPDAKDNVEAFNRAIAHCRDVHASMLVVPAGTYRFTSDAPLAFNGLEDFTFDGRGSTFIFLKKRGEMMRINACQRTVFKDFALDWDWEQDPLASIVRVEATAATSVDFRFTGHPRFPRRDVRVADIEQLDPATQSVGCEGAVNIGFEVTRGKCVPRTEWLGDDLLRLHLAGGEPGARLQPGMLFRMRHYVYDMPGVVMQDNSHLTLSGVKVFSCPSHAFVTQGEQHHWQFLKVDIVPPPGSRRPITCTADHHHIARSQGYFKMESCEFSLGGDDCLNVHDTTAFAERTGPRTLRTRNFNNWQPFRPGDPVELRQDDYAPTGFTAPLTRFAAVDPSKGAFELTFESDLPPQTGDGFVLFNRRFGSRQVIIRNCIFRDNRARGLLLLGSDITVEGNRFFHNQMGAIRIETGYTFTKWSEGYGASNIVIRNNRFEQGNPMGAYPHDLMPAIDMSVYLRTDPSTEKTGQPILHDILVEGNAFVDNPGAIAYVCSAANVIIRNNTVENHIPRRAEAPYRGGIGTSYSRGVYVTGNTWRLSPGMPAPALRLDPATTSAVHCWDNTVRDCQVPAERDKVAATCLAERVSARR